MLKWNKVVFELCMGDEAEERIRKAAIVFAVVGFFVHIGFWALDSTGRISITGEAAELVSSPLSSLYTPFSILLVYEVYQLIRTIPDSFSSSVGKQYEIATLLVVRDILKRLSEVESSEGWEISSDLGFLLVECAAFLALFYTSLTYFRISDKSTKSGDMSGDIAFFVEAKRLVANFMLIVFLLTCLFLLHMDCISSGRGRIGK